MTRRQKGVTLVGFNRQRPCPSVKQRPNFRPSSEQAFISLGTRFHQTTRLLHRLVTWRFVILYPARAYLFNDFIKMRESPRLAMSLPARDKERGRLHTILRLRFINRRRARFMHRSFVGLLRTQRGHRIRRRRVDHRRTNRRRNSSRRWHANG